MIRNIVSRATRSVVAVAMLAAASLFAADVAYSASDTLIGRLKAAEARDITRAAEVLPPPTRNTRPFRQRAFGNCEVPNEGNLCRFQFLKVGDNRLLEISNIACVADGSSGF